MNSIFLPRGFFSFTKPQSILIRFCSFFAPVFPGSRRPFILPPFILFVVVLSHVEHVAGQIICVVVSPLKVLSNLARVLYVYFIFLCFIFLLSYRW